MKSYNNINQRGISYIRSKNTQMYFLLGLYVLNIIGIIAYTYSIISYENYGFILPIFILSMLIILYFVKRLNDYKKSMIVGYAMKDNCFCFMYFNLFFFRRNKCIRIDSENYKYETKTMDNLNVIEFIIDNKKYLLYRDFFNDSINNLFK